MKEYKVFCVIMQLKIIIIYFCKKSMEINKVEFVKSSTNLKQCPKPDYAEYAFIGRSNVGKSSFINMITNKEKLAKVSCTPGKTREINHFLINGAFYIVDLPGYGYAKTSKSNRDKWQEFIEEYLLNRDTLFCTFVLVDSNIPPQKIDLEFINWLGENRIPLAIIFTKIDRVTKNAVVSNVAAFKKELLKFWEELPTIYLTSSEKKQGKEEVLKYIKNTNASIQVIKSI